MVKGKPAFTQVRDNRKAMMADRQPVVDETRLKAVFRALSDHGVDYVVFGAVTRYRSVEEMPPPWRDANDPGNL